LAFKGKIIYIKAGRENTSLAHIQNKIALQVSLFFNHKWGKVCFYTFLKEDDSRNIKIKADWK
jgi:hypothetical protein